MSTIRKVLKTFAFAYLAAFLITFAHFPSVTKRSALELSPYTPILPGASVAIVRAYGQFALAGTWPFGSRPNVVLLDELIASKGIPISTGAPLREIAFNHNPELRPGQEGRTVYRLSSAGYEKAFYGAFIGLSGGGLLKIGRYFCLMSNVGLIQGMIGPSQCHELIFRPESGYYWRALGEKAEKPVLLVD